MRTSPVPQIGRLLCWLAAPLLAAPPLLSLWYIHEYGVNAAHWDHLISAELFDRFYSGTLTLEYLFRPHLEHVKAVPRLVSLGLGIATRFNNVAEMYFQWMLLCATAAILFVAIRRRAGLSRCAFLFAFVPIPFALFTLRQHESMLVGDGMITYLSIAAVVAAICLLEDARSPRRAIAATAAAVAASFSHASALLVWPIGIAILALPWTAVPRGGIRRISLAIWIAAASAVIAVYVFRLPSAAGAPLDYALAHPGQSLRYVLAAAGVSFAPETGPQVAFGIAAVALETVVLAASLWTVRSTGRLPLGLWLLVFVIGSRLLMAVGRVIGAPVPIVPSRYAAFMALAGAGAYAASLEIRRRARIAGALAAGAALVLIAATTWFGYTEGWRAGPGERDMRLRIRQLLETTRTQTDTTLQALLYPNPDHARAYAAALERLQLNVFAERQVDPAALPRSGGARVHLDALNGRHAAPEEAIPVSPGDTIHLAGWAFEQTANAPFDRAFVLVDGRTAIPAAYGLYRPDVARKIGNDLSSETGFEARFAAASLAPGEHTLALQFVTADGERTITTEPVARIAK